MSTAASKISLSFTPWSRDNVDETALKDILARVHVERGHFRDITEASLQEEIAAEGALELSESDEDGDDEADDGAAYKSKAPTTREELYTAKRNMAINLDAAHQEVMMALDFMSLLQSKYAPSQGWVSGSEELKKRAPPGTLGVDMWDLKAMPADPARTAQDAMLASKVRMLSLQQSADDLLAAATRLQDNVRKETLYWDQVLSIKEKGWSVSKIPKSYLLGVHFGVKGCIDRFAQHQVAALIGTGDGSVMLERGVGTKPKAVRVIVRKKGHVVGGSRLPSVADNEEISLESRIRHARDSVYDEELYHELTREARTLSSMGVHFKGSAICFTSGGKQPFEMELQLVSLDVANSLPSSALRDLNALAQATLLAARLLLGQKHRENIAHRTALPPPLSNKKDSRQQDFSILRPLLLLLEHHSLLHPLNAYLRDAAQLVRNLRIAHTSTEFRSASMTLPAPAEDRPLDAEMLITAVARAFVSDGVLRIDLSHGPALDFTIRVETIAGSGLGPSFTVMPPGGAEPVTWEDLTDAFSAVDDLLALALGRALKEPLGDAWTLNAREGSLTRRNPPGVDAKAGIEDSLWFSVQLAGVERLERKISLYARTREHGVVRRDWSLESCTGTMADILNELVD